MNYPWIIHCASQPSQVRALDLEDIDAECYQCPTYVYERKDDKRTEIMMPIRLPHEALRKHFVQNPQQFDPDQIDSRHWDVPAYTKHPIVRTHAKVAGLGLHRDKVALFRPTGFIRMSINVIWVRRRISIYYILTMCLCRCGCNGACTLDPLQKCVNWIRDESKST